MDLKEIGLRAWTGVTWLSTGTREQVMNFPSP